ncbi:MAG TPA: hypothetical protein VMB85_22215 [Bryobacteraceae bacterium]|nr:hypothetical protein [Bryobacteraceae bacterium]
MADKSRERALESALLNLYEAWARLPISPGYTRPYRAERFRQTVVPSCKRYKGGVQAVKDVLLKTTTHGFERLRPYPKLTVEYLVASGEWDDLFTEPLRKLARKKLRVNVP